MNNPFERLAAALFFVLIKERVWLLLRTWSPGRKSVSVGDEVIS